MQVATSATNNLRQHLTRHGLHLPTSATGRLTQARKDAAIQWYNSLFEAEEDGDDENSDEDDDAEDDHAGDNRAEEDDEKNAEEDNEDYDEDDDWEDEDTAAD
jgi:AAA ATPase containing von Willebrand factor type A (vWA) domain